MTILKSVLAKHYIIAHDPGGDYLPGAIVTAAEAPELQSQGVALLPVDAEAVSNGGPVSGYFLRQWGAGWPLNSPIPKMVCPMLLQVTPTVRELHWLAQIVRDPAYAEAPGWRGLCTIAATPAFQGGALGIVGQSNVRELPLEDSSGGWLVGGSLTVTCNSEGYTALSLYASAPGYAVAWASATIL
jgi:hypothetical protein